MALVQGAAAISDEQGPQPDLRGTATGWLRVLDHKQLLQSVQADKAIREIWRQSRLSGAVWERDCLPALQRYAEFVQLVPASEAHHHAHVGGLLSHTIEMMLAAMTWRNGHLLPAGESIEAIDSQRDEWTYVVFFAALLHDIAKPLTDLRILWRSDEMADPLQWMPLAGSLGQISQGRKAPEYLVEFAPKSARDYTAHARLAMMLLPGIAPRSALTFIARQPKAFEALNRYLTGGDKDSLLAQIVLKADRASTQRSLLTGSKARFTTATAVPLIDLLMQAIGSMLRSGTSLPLNRSGAAGWVHDGSVWFVAKRIADSVRTWIKTHAPDESVPGDSKNDRLFDTWQEYGCIQVNPASGQAIWYVTVHGYSNEAEPDAGIEASSPLEQGAYKHSLTMLRFPLNKLYRDAAQYPAEMRGRIEVHAKRKGDIADGNDTPNTTEPEGNSAREIGATQASASAMSYEAVATPARQQPDSVVVDNPARAAHAPQATTSGKPSQRKPKIDLALKEPAFNKPKRKPEPAVPPESAPLARAPAPAPGTASATAQEPATASDDETCPDEVYDAILLEDAAAWLDAADDVSAAVTKQPMQLPRKTVAAATAHTHEPAAAVQQAIAPQIAPLLAAPPRRALTDTPEPVVLDRSGTAPKWKREAASHETSIPTGSGPVLLAPRMPALPKSADGGAPAEPSARARAFMGWLQSSLASRRLKYNQTGATVHFTAEGMALVSPLIFKTYARELGHEDDADEHGLQVQREVIKAGWHMMGPNKANILGYEVIGRGGATRGKLSAVVLIAPDRWVAPVPPPNPALKLRS